MQKGLGIAALVLSILAIFVPVAGPWLTVLVAVMAAFAYGPGLGMAVAAIIINIVNLIFLSPQVWAALALNPAIALVLFGAQVAAMIVLIVLHKKHQPSITVTTGTSEEIAQRATTTVPTIPESEPASLIQPIPSPILMESEAPAEKESSETRLQPVTTLKPDVIGVSKWALPLSGFIAAAVVGTLGYSLYET